MEGLHRRVLDASNASSGDTEALHRSELDAIDGASGGMEGLHPHALDASNELAVKRGPESERTSSSVT